MLINVPIEDLEDRYSKQWNDNFPKEFLDIGVKWVTIYPDRPMPTTVQQGQFLDVVNTNIFKAAQLEILLEMIRDGQICDDDTFFFHDLWFPGIESLFYVRDALELNFKIAGMLHAGTYDKHDFLSQKGMGRWGKALEQSWFTEVDKIFVATHFHKRMLSDRVDDPRKIFVTGFPLWNLDPMFEWDEKENLVVFPHRLAPEKQPHMFDSLISKCAPKMQGWDFCKTKVLVNNKKEYYKLLSRSKIAVSFALQETWGIAQQEALFHGCIPVVPDRLSYREMYPRYFRFNSITEAAKKVVQFSKMDFREDQKLYDELNRLLQSRKQKCGQAVKNMMNLLSEESHIYENNNPFLISGTTFR